MQNMRRNEMETNLHEPQFGFTLIWQYAFLNAIMNKISK